jgi:hypothetical protein
VPIFRGKNFVSAVSDYKDSVRVVLRSNIQINGTVSQIDGVVLEDKDRVLVVGQSTTSENGIYAWATGTQKLTRSNDADSIFELSTGVKVFVAEGTNNARSSWVLITNGVINPGVTGLVWTKELQSGNVANVGVFGDSTKTLKITVDETGQVDSVEEITLNADNIAEGQINRFFTNDSSVDGGEF